MVSDGDGRVVVFPVLGGVQVMIDRRQNNVVANQRAIANRNSALVLKVTARIDEDVFTELDVLSKVSIKRRKHTKGWINRIPGNLFHQLNDFFGRMISRVQFHLQLQVFLADFIESGSALGSVRDVAAFAKTSHSYQV